MADMIAAHIRDSKSGLVYSVRGYMDVPERHNRTWMVRLCRYHKLDERMLQAPRISYEAVA